MSEPMISLSYLKDDQNTSQKYYEKSAQDGSILQNSTNLIETKKKEAADLVKNVVFELCEACGNKGSRCECKINPLLIFHCEFSQKRGPRL